MDRFSLHKSSLFLDRVRNQNFSFAESDISFNKVGKIMKIEDVQHGYVSEFHLKSIYTSSKAVYWTSGYYVGIVIVDSSLYITPISETIMDINFNKLTLLGIKERYLF